jgi:hypothetical protein
VNSHSGNGASTYAPQPTPSPVVAQSARLALLLAILGFMIPALGVLAVVKSHAAREEIVSSGGQKSGIDLVEKARTLGLVSVFFWVGITVLYAMVLR